jgi:hypothetical protein
MKKKVMIYVDGDVWEAVKKAAWRAQKSTSQYVQDVFAARVTTPAKNIKSPCPSEGLETVAERIRAKRKTEKPKTEIADGKVDTPKGKVKANPALVKFTGGYSKDAQLGKKGSK